MKMEDAIKQHHESAYLIHTNGVQECLTCHHLFIPTSLLHIYTGPRYVGKVTEVEEEEPCNA